MARRIFYNDEERVAYAARFAAELAQVLYDLGVTHREVAQELGVAHATVDSWTRIADPKVPGEHNLRRLSDFLERKKGGAGARIAAAAGQPAGVSLPAVATSRERNIVSDSWAEVGKDTHLPAEVADANPSNLLPALTQFVGRHEEIIEVRRLLESARLLTLVGAGGIGKTRLALEIARGLDHYPDGVWLVELDALLDPELIPAAIAQALPSVQHPGSLSGETLAAYIGEMRLMILLDNCEHLVEACAEVSVRLLQRCPNISMMATSREPLSCPGETVWQVRTLSTPDSQGSLDTPETGNNHPDADALCAVVSKSEAVQLFLARARERQAGFELTAQNAPDVAEICIRLDGIPLALELAAARVSAMSVEEIARRLDTCLQLLTHGRRTRLPRQQALHASLDWSHELLTPTERVLFRRLGVFVGGWTLAAAEGICTGGGLSTYGVLNNLMQLVDKSLVLVEQAEGTTGGTRYRFLETVRQYALEQLADSNEAETVSLGHAQFFTSLVERASPDFYAHTRQLGHAQVRAELDNVRAALAWTIGNRDAGRDGEHSFLEGNEHVESHRLSDAVEDASADERRTELGLRLVGALDTFWGSRGELAEASRWAEKAMAKTDTSQRTAARARVLTMLGRTKIQRGQYAGLHESLAESESIWREVGDKIGLAGTLTLIAAGYFNIGRLADGRARFAESAALAEEAGDSSTLAFILFAWGNIELEFGDLERAQIILQRSVAICEANGIAAFHTVPMVSLGRVAWLKGDYEIAQQIVEEALSARIGHHSEWAIAGAQNSLADIVRCLGDYKRASILADSSLVIFRKVGDRSSAAWVLYTLGHTAMQSGDHVQATKYWRESLVLDREFRKDRDAITCLAALACGYYGAGELSRSATLFGVADALLDKVSVRWSPYDAETYQRYRSETQDQLGEALFRSDWEKGQAMEEDEAVALALSAI